MALKAAAFAVRQMRRTEDEAQLRDVWALRGTADLGPAGQVLAAWRQLVERSPMLDAEHLARFATLFGMPLPVDEVRFILDQLQTAQSKPLTPLMAAAEFWLELRITQAGQGPLGLWLVDLLIAQKACWPRSVPLLGALGIPRSIAGQGGDARQAFLAAAVHPCTTAVDTAAEIERRSTALLATLPRLRSQQAGVVAALLNDDALAPSAAPGLSDRAGRRVVDRLVTLGAIRELTGRPTFRLYGL